MEYSPETLFLITRAKNPIPASHYGLRLKTPIMHLPHSQKNGNFTSSDELSMALDTLSQLSSQPSIMNRASGSRINTVPSHLLQSKIGGTGLSDPKINNGQLSKLIRSVEGADSLHTWYDYRSNQERNSALNTTNHSGSLANNPNRNGMHSNTEKNPHNVKNIKSSNRISKTRMKCWGLQ